MEDSRVKSLLSKILWLATFKRVDALRGRIGVSYRFKIGGPWGVLSTKPYIEHVYGTTKPYGGSRLGGRWLPRD